MKLTTLLENITRKKHYMIPFDLPLCSYFRYDIGSMHYGLRYLPQWARKFKKVQAKKKLEKSNKSISRKTFFYNFKNDQKSIFELGNV